MYIIPILFGQHGVGILRVSAAGGTPEVLVPLDLPVRGHGPQILPGDKAVLLTLGDGPNWNDAQIVVHSLETGERKVLIEDGRDARHLPTGHLVYVLDGTLLAVPFDAERLEVTGGPVPMVEGIDSASPSGASQFSVSDTGSLVYVSGQTTKRTLVWVDREGREEVLKVEPRAFSHPRISPDGSRIALALRDQEEDIWIWDLARETLTRLTFAPGRDSYPVWTLDGQRLVFSSDRDGSQNLYWKAADGTGSVERLTKSESDHFAYAFTPAGGQLVFLELGEQGADLGVLTLEGSSEPLLATEFDERTAALSPNGRWLAYESNDSRQYEIEIYVRPFPNVDEGHWQITRDGGSRPLWAPDGRELFYLRGGALTAVRVQTESGFVPGNTEVVVRGNFHAPLNPRARTYDISPDGKRFLMIKEPSGESFLNGDHPHPKLVPRAGTPRPHRALARPRLLIKPVLLQIPPQMLHMAPHRQLELCII